MLNVYQLQIFFRYRNIFPHLTIISITLFSFSRCLVFDPRLRAGCGELLEHPFLKPQVKKKLYTLEIKLTIFLLIFSSFFTLVIQILYHEIDNVRRSNS